MDKEQYKPESESREHGQDVEKGAPGQQLPTGSNAKEINSVQAKEEQHSESSLPQNGETLGTP